MANDGQAVGPRGEWYRLQAHKGAAGPKPGSQSLFALQRPARSAAAVATNVTGKRTMITLGRVRTLLWGFAQNLETVPGACGQAAARVTTEWQG